MDCRLFATLSEATGKTDISLNVEESVILQEAFDELLAANPALADEVLNESGNLADHIRLLVNGKDPFVEDEGWDTVVGPDDELSLFPPVSGG